VSEASSRRVTEVSVPDGERTEETREENRSALQEEYLLLVTALEGAWKIRARQVIWAVCLTIGLGIGIMAGMVRTVMRTGRQQAEITRLLQEQVTTNRLWVTDLRAQRKVDALRYQTLIQALENARRRLDQRQRGD
jgi:hypothetical protein